MRLTEDRLTKMALAALEEVAALCREAPVRRSAALRLVLAYLASRRSCDRYFFDAFWRAVITERPRDRSAVVEASLNGIYRQLSRKRDPDAGGHYEAAARDDG